VIEHFRARALIKSGAEGLLCGALPDAGLGIAVKCDDGAGRAAEVVSAGAVRAHNEAMAELVERYPQDLRAYAYLDPFGGARMLEQARELVRKSGKAMVIEGAREGAEILLELPARSRKR